VLLIGSRTVVAKIVGTVNPITARNSMDACIPTFSLLKNCSLNLNPLVIMLKPKIKRIFPRIAPVIDALTSSNNPALIATIAIMISAAFPNVTLSKDPSVAP
jgi:hypothetical protein